jgi:hypothetical protein
MAICYRKTEDRLGSSRARFCVCAQNRSRPVPAAWRGGQGRAKFSSAEIPHNPLISLDSDERIQGNPTALKGGVVAKRPGPRKPKRVDDRSGPNSTEFHAPHSLRGDEHALGERQASRFLARGAGGRRCPLLAERRRFRFSCLDEMALKVVHGGKLERFFACFGLNRAIGEDPVIGSSRRIAADQARRPL